MTYLLDTHYMIWVLTDTRQLSKEIKDILTDPGNQIIVSEISFWEVSLKSSLGKLEIKGFSPEDLPVFCEQVGFEFQDLSVKGCSTYHKLKGDYRKDPFDRMLIWEAIANDYILISTDANVRKYVSEGLKIL